VFVPGRGSWSAALLPPAREAAPEPSPLANFVGESSHGTAAWGDKSSKSYLIPAVEIVGFEFLLNQFNRNYDSEKDVYRTDLHTIQKNLHEGWVIDRDPFATNQFLHPYQGTIYHGFARSAGLNYWESLGYDFAASALWEVAGETGPPSLNDQITTSLGGSFFGEALFRMASYLLESGGPNPGFLRELGATLVAPSAGFNRIVYDRFDGVFPSKDPAVFMRAGIGARRNGKVTSVSDLNDVPNDEVVVDFAFDYGLPGKTGYEYERPFDYFHFEVTGVSSTDALPEDVIVRGLLAGADYDWGHSYQGVWGLYGAYDYFSPEVFSVSSTSLGLGTTGQWRASDALTMQGTVMGGLGWTAVGTISDAQEDRTYHYGASPQALVALRVLFGNVAMLDMSGREYYLGSVSGLAAENSDTVLRGSIALTVRVYGHHALGIQYVESHRDARFDDRADSSESIASLSLFYTYISDTWFSAVK
jgi:hypothetical protein